MSVIVAYLMRHGDSYLTETEHRIGCVWRSLPHEAKRFPNQTEAQRYLFYNNYDLPWVQVAFETVPD